MSIQERQKVVELERRVASLEQSLAELRAEIAELRKVETVRPTLSRKQA